MVVGASCYLLPQFVAGVFFCQGLRLSYRVYHKLVSQRFDQRVRPDVRNEVNSN